MKRTRAAVDLKEEIRQAIDRVWAQRVEEQKKGGGFRGTAHFFTATDVEREVREEISFKLTGMRFDRGIRISGLNGNTLLGLVRNVLLSQTREGRWECHNHGRGHISGMRFRAAGSPLAEAEEKSLALPREERMRRKFIKHWARATDGKAACGCDDRKRSPYSFRGRNWKPKPVTEVSKVTCKKCLQLIEKSEKEIEDSHRLGIAS